MTASKSARLASIANINSLNLLAKKDNAIFHHLLGSKDSLEPKHLMNASILSSSGTFAACSNCSKVGIMSE